MMRRMPCSGWWSARRPSRRWKRCAASDISPGCSVQVYHTYQLLRNACHPELKACCNHGNSSCQSRSARPAAKVHVDRVLDTPAPASPQVEDLLEYYMQRAATLQSESERLLAGARDLEESVGVSLSARRFEVQPPTRKQRRGGVRDLAGARQHFVAGQTNFPCALPPYAQDAMQIMLQAWPKWGHM
jgi:hypothetical protein